MKAVCTRCGNEYTIQEYENDRFCRNCGSLLKPDMSDTDRRRKHTMNGQKRDDLFLYDIELATSIGEILHRQFQNKIGYFEGHVMPEYIMPPINEGSKELALYYTYVIAVDYQTDAHKLWRNARRLYPEHSEYFEPESILQMQDEKLRTFVKRLGTRFPSNGANAWKKISQILLSRYDGDPRNITREPSTARDVWKKLEGFPHLRGPKVGTLYLRVMGDLGLFKVSDLDRLDVAVDVQVSRFTFYTGVLKPLRPLEGWVHYPPIRPAIERVWRQAASKTGCAPWQLDMPIWAIASNQCTDMRCNPCPVKGLCERNFDVSVQGNNLKYSG